MMGQFLTHLEPKEPKKLSHRSNREIGRPSTAVVHPRNAASFVWQ
jgi:hypothetical protein